MVACSMGWWDGLGMPKGRRGAEGSAGTGSATDLVTPALVPKLPDTHKDHSIHGCWEYFTLKPSTGNQEFTSTSMAPSRCRHPRGPFSFMKLPADVQVHILSCMDLRSLHATIHSVPHAKHLFLRYPSSILHGATAVMGLHLRNLILTIHSVVQSITSGVDAHASQVIGDMSAFLEANLDTEEPRKIHYLETDALFVLGSLTKIESEMLCRHEAFIQDAYERACRNDNPGVAPPLLVVSPEETHRAMRAFYRLKLFGVLFYDYADRFRVDLQTSYDSFFERLATFEIDELVTVYQFLIRERMFFTSAFPHGDCSYVPIKPYRDNRDPFNCQTCRGRCLGPNNPSSPWWRGVQPFWHTVEGRFVHEIGLWAIPSSCRQTPIKLWQDVTATNQSNSGWLRWSNYLEYNDVNRDCYIQNFRRFGYCFWGRERLETWQMLEEI